MTCAALERGEESADAPRLSAAAGARAPLAALGHVIVAVPRDPGESVDGGDLLGWTRVARTG